eukprot:scaffold22268_cov123-Isochrysis_galbana.AAC.1
MPPRDLSKCWNGWTAPSMAGRKDHMYHINNSPEDDDPPPSDDDLTFNLLDQTFSPLIKLLKQQVTPTISSLVDFVKRALTPYAIREVLVLSLAGGAARARRGRRRGFLSLTSFFFTNQAPHCGPAFRRHRDTLFGI